MKFQIEEIDNAGNFIARISGMGRNRGTWDSACNSRRTAQRWLAKLRKLHPSRKFTIAAI